jgi:hypothetical protein
MNSPAKDKVFFEAGLQELEPYLLSKELYWPSPVHTADFTQITLGALLLVRARLTGWKSPGLTESAAQMDAVRSKWRSAWETKARRELHARSELWKNYLGEIRSSPGESARTYPYEVRQRAILSLLMDELPERSDATVTALDQTLRALLRPGGFVWDAALEPVFPKDLFWFLYGALN